jgi:hypothetical protein
MGFQKPRLPGFVGRALLLQLCRVKSRLRSSVPLGTLARDNHHLTASLTGHFEKKCAYAWMRSSKHITASDARSPQSASNCDQWNALAPWCQPGCRALRTPGNLSSPNVRQTQWKPRWRWCVIRTKGAALSAARECRQRGYVARA